MLAAKEPFENLITVPMVLRRATAPVSPQEYSQRVNLQRIPQVWNRKITSINFVGLVGWPTFSDQFNSLCQPIISQHIHNYGSGYNYYITASFLNDDSLKVISDLPVELMLLPSVNSNGEYFRIEPQIIDFESSYITFNWEVMQEYSQSNQMIYLVLTYL